MLKASTKALFISTASTFAEENKFKYVVLVSCVCIFKLVVKRNQYWIFLQFLKIYWDLYIFYNMCVFNLVFKRNQSGQLLQVFARNNASILDIISLNCAPETLRRLSKVLRRLFMIDSTLKCAPETSTCAPETFSVLKFAPAKTCSKSARRGARCAHGS